MLKRAPKPLKAVAWRVWRDYVRWPLPVLYLTRKRTLSVGGRSFAFVGIGDHSYRQWARAVHAGEWEPTVAAYLTDTICEGDVVLDVGAYVGAYSLLASRLVGSAGHVFAFEPDPAARTLLEGNLRANGTANVTVIASALSSHVGEVGFEGSGHSQGFATAGGGTPATTLAAFCAERDITPAVLKIDIEGGEAAALAPAACGSVLRAARAVVVEIHEFAGVDYSEIEATMRAAGKAPRFLEERRVGNFDVAFS